MLFSLAVAAVPLEMGTQHTVAPPHRDNAATIGSGLWLGWRPHSRLAIRAGASGILTLPQREPIVLYTYKGDVPVGYRTRMRGEGELSVTFSPIQTSLRRSKVSLDLGTGLGLLKTHDDAEWAGIWPGDPDDLFAATEKQIHPTLVWRAGSRIDIREHWGVSAGVRGTHWIEVYESIRKQGSTRIQGVFEVYYRL